jgi:hypothetical protein
MNIMGRRLDLKPLACAIAQFPFHEIDLFEIYRCMCNIEGIKKSVFIAHVHTYNQFQDQHYALENS